MSLNENDNASTEEVFEDLRIIKKLIAQDDSEDYKTISSCEVIRVKLKNNKL